MRSDKITQVMLHYALLVYILLENFMSFRKMHIHVFFIRIQIILEVSQFAKIITLLFVKW